MASVASVSLPGYHGSQTATRTHPSLRTVYPLPFLCLSHLLLPSCDFRYNYVQVLLNVMFSLFIFLVSSIKGVFFFLEVMEMEEFSLFLQVLKTEAALCIFL